QKVAALVLAWRAGLTVVGRTEVVADLVGSDQRIAERIERRLCQPDAEALRAQHADVCDADDIPVPSVGLVEIAAGEQVQQPRAAPRRRNELVVLELVQQRERIRLARRA